MASRHFFRRALPAVVVAAVFAVSGCTAPAMVLPSQSPPPSHPPASGDGVLRIGTLLPTSGAVSFLAPAQVAGVELAVREINESGGVLGQPVEVFHRNSGEASAQTAEASLAELIDKGVDVIIGPSSSVIAERILPTVVDAGILMVSPSALSAALTPLDDSGLLARTAPSAGLQGAALARAIADAGAASAAVLTFDDESGDAVLSSFTAAAADVGLEIVAHESFAASSSTTGLVSLIDDAAPDAVVLASPFSAVKQNVEIIAALTAAGHGGDSLWLSSGAVADYSQLLPDGTLTDARGVLEGASVDSAFVARIKSMTPSVADTRFAAEAYDATVLAILAAAVAGDDAGASLAFVLRDVSSGGIKCLSLGECLDVLTSQSDIDYDGISGPVDLDAHGDVVSARLGIQKYGADNRFTVAGDVFTG